MEDKFAYEFGQFTGILAFAAVGFVFGSLIFAVSGVDYIETTAMVWTAYPIMGEWFCKLVIISSIHLSNTW